MNRQQQLRSIDQLTAVGRFDRFRQFLTLPGEDHVSMLANLPFTEITNKPRNIGNDKESYKKALSDSLSVRLFGTNAMMEDGNKSINRSKTEAEMIDQYCSLLVKPDRRPSCLLTLKSYL